MTTVALRPALLRPRDAVIAGVCAGLAAHLGWRVGVVRLFMTSLVFASGSGLLLYAWLWALVPLVDTGADDAGAVRRRAPVAAILAVGASIATITAMAALATGNEIVATGALLGVSAAGGAAVAWNLGFDRHDPSRSKAYGLGVRVGCAAILFLAGAIALLSRPSAINAVLGVGMVVLAVGVVIAPRVVTLWSDLMTERSARVREEQRAEIAAHLHDSVLQTLALIQNRAGASSEVARIARAQERELRDWLFAADEPVAADLATELRRIAAAIELDYPVRIEVVAAGDSGFVTSPALVGAAREAMLNAARHAGGDVFVYLETSSSAVDVYVRDRGAGVRLEDVPADRLGIRESILGRMTRAGGTATLGPGAGGSGTEVHLHQEVQRD